MSRILRALHRDDRGTAAVSFILCLPIFLTIVAVVVQFALLVNAKLMVTYAAQCAARAAITSLPERLTDNPVRAARLALVPLSPRTQGQVASEAVAVGDALMAVGVNVPDSFRERYTYAMDATDVQWTGGNFPGRRGQDIEVTVRYRFYLTVPAAMLVLSPRIANVGGVRGRFFELRSTVRVQSAHGREAAADGSGWAW